MNVPVIMEARALPGSRAVVFMTVAVASEIAVTPAKIIEAPDTITVALASKAVDSATIAVTSAKIAVVTATIASATIAVVAATVAEFVLHLLNVVLGCNRSCRR